MRFLTEHGDEIVEEYFSSSWDEYREYIDCIDVTPVNKFMNENPHIFEDVREDFGCVRPPWENTWAEYVIQKGNGLKRAGMDIHAPQEGEISTVKGRVEEEVFEGLFLNDEVEHIYTFLTFACMRNRWKAEGVVFIFLDEDGRFVSDPSRRFFPMPYDDMLDACESADKARLILVSRIMPTLLGFGFAHCPNVKIWEDEKAPAIRKKRKKSGKNPGQTFKCLDIEPLQEEIRRSAPEESGESERRRHKVRGHFRYYSEDAPLFGHYTGNVWVPAHERGSEEEGRIEKEYRSQSPNQSDETDE